jgi:hypothetical protein
MYNKPMSEEEVLKAVRAGQKVIEQWDIDVRNYYSIDIAQDQKSGRYWVVVTDLVTEKRYKHSEHDTPENAIKAAGDFKFDFEEEWQGNLDLSARQQAEIAGLQKELDEWMRQQAQGS